MPHDPHRLPSRLFQDLVHIEQPRRPVDPQPPSRNAAVQIDFDGFAVEQMRHPRRTPTVVEDDAVVGVEHPDGRSVRTEAGDGSEQSGIERYYRYMG